MADPINIVYNASPTLAKFHGSGAFVRGVRGPIGSGKSVGCCNEVFAQAQLQRKGKGGKRRSRWAVIRNTYAELISTTIKTWGDWYGEITRMVYGAPIMGYVRYGDIELELVFISLDKPKDVKKLKSLELTGVWINEASEIPKAVLDMATGRVGRYPSKKDGGSTRSCVIMDTNSPDDSHWWYDLAEVKRPLGWEFFAQPPALIRVAEGIYKPNPKAENIEHLQDGYGYYERQLSGKKEEWIKVFILGQYGTIQDGKPVYTEYRDDFHCAPDILEPLRGIGLLLGWDYGRTPACVIAQLTPKGQLRVIDELVVDATGDGMGIRTFTRDHVKPHLAAQYPGMPINISWGDPAGGAKDNTELDSFQIQAAEGIPTEAASTNDPASRQDAVVSFLKANVDGEPAFLLSPKCVFLRKGFLGGYQFERVQVSGEERYKEQPKKNRYSHPHDALQYDALAAKGGNKVKAKAQARPVQQRSAGGWT